VFSLFPIITNTLFGLQSVAQEYHDLFTLHGAGRLSRLRRLQLPAAMPAVFTGFRISAGLSVIGAIVGDFFFRQGEPGVGRLLDLYSQRLETEQLLTAIFFSSLLGLVVFWGVGWLGHRVVGAWYDPKQR
jgi:NitT/TauT family transport system permease protein